MRARPALIGLLIVLLLGVPLAVRAQHPRVDRIGVVLLGGQYTGAVQGLRDGLKELGREEGKDFVLHVRDLKGDREAIASAARSLEGKGVDVIYSVTTSVTIAVKAATSNVPIVFYAGSDPVTSGLVREFRKPGGRLTGIYSRLTPLMAKRLELLKEMMPNLRRVAIFYDPSNPLAEEAATVHRDAARQLNMQVVERPVRSVQELGARLDALRPGEVDAIAYVDSMVVSQTAMVLKAARAKRLATMVPDSTTVAQGALASYGVSYYTAGRLAAKPVRRILQGADPADLPVEQIDRLHFALNLRTAKTLGLTIPPSVVLRADELIE